MSETKKEQQRSKIKADDQPAADNYLNTTDAGKKQKEIAVIHDEITNTLVSVRRSYVEQTNRLNELKRLDNLVTSGDLETKTIKLDLRIQELDSTVRNAKRALADVEFASVVFFARSDDRKALETLMRLARNPSGADFVRAKEVVDDIVSEWENPIVLLAAEGGWSVSPLPPNVNSMRQAYTSVPRHLKPSAIRFIWNCPEYPKGHKLGFLIELIGRPCVERHYPWVAATRR
jgi:hypothetical protein